MTVLLLGKDGQVGTELQTALAGSGLIAVGRAEADLTSNASLIACIDKYKPQVIINAAAYTAVDKAESDIATAQQVNATAVGVVANAAKKHNALLIHYSTDYVFDGTKDGAYIETDTPNPLSVYGATKLAGEMEILSSACRHFILRTSWVYGLHGLNFPKKILKLAAERPELRIVADQYGAPTSTGLLAAVTARLIEDESAAYGIYHLAPCGETTWYGIAQFVVTEAARCGKGMLCSPSSIYPITTDAYPLPAERPANSRLNCSKLEAALGIMLPPWQDDMKKFVAALYAKESA